MLVIFCYMNIHVTEMKNNRRPYSYPQFTTSESFTLNMTRQIEMNVIGETTELTRKLMKAYLYTNQLK